MFFFIALVIHYFLVGVEFLFIVLALESPDLVQKVEHNFLYDILRLEEENGLQTVGMSNPTLYIL